KVKGLSRDNGILCLGIPSSFGRRAWHLCYIYNSEDSQDGSRCKGFTLNPGKLPTREVIKGVEVHRLLIADATNIFPLLVADDL
ncbi:MAG: hypothetical protein ACUVTD_08090, partial [Nitrososphaerales archaeon]